MEREFWLDRWRSDQIGFHQARVNDRLQRFWPALGIARDAGGFVPLCGKSRDMVWLAERGHSVLGAELSSIAVEAFFAETATPHSRRQQGSFVAYEGERI